MKHIAAYLLLQTGGNASPSASDIKGLLDTVGIEADQAQLDKLISELEGKDINQVSRKGGVDQKPSSSLPRHEGHAWPKHF